jgi:hypothetical protein
MTDRIIADIVTVLTAIVGLAIIAVIVGKNSQTPGVIKQAGSSFASIITAAVKPVS